MPDIIIGNPDNYVPKLNDAGEQVSQTTEEILVQRGSRYGTFSTQAKLSQKLSSTIIEHIKLHSDITILEPFHLEAINMICHKLARIANGDPNYDDSWKDIAGYSQLVVDILHGKNP